MGTHSPYPLGTNQKLINKILLKVNHNFFKKVKIIVDKEIKFDIIEMHVENAAVVQRLVHLIAIQMMTVRFRSVAPINNARSDELLFLFKNLFFLHYVYFVLLFLVVSEVII